jgi:hypothetical protein
MLMVDLPDDELAALIAALRRVIDEDRFPLSPRLDVLKAALGKLQATANTQHAADSSPHPKAPPDGSPKEPSSGKGGKRVRR